MAVQMDDDSKAVSVAQQASLEDLRKGQKKAAMPTVTRKRKQKRGMCVAPAEVRTAASVQDHVQNQHSEVSVDLKCIWPHVSTDRKISSATPIRLKSNGDVFSAAMNDAKRVWQYKCPQNQMMIIIVAASKTKRVPEKRHAPRKITDPSFAPLPPHQHLQRILLAREQCDTLQHRGDLHAEARHRRNLRIH